MHPILFEIPKFEILNGVFGPFPIRVYGLMIGIGFVLGIYLASRQARKERISPDHIFDMGVYLLLAAIVGSRALYVLTSLHEFTRNPLDIFAIWKGGLVFYGGLLAAVPTGFWYVKKHNLPAWKIADIMAPSIALGHGFGRLGCFFAGCCYGTECNGPLGITFTDPRSLAPLGVPLYPVQLFESGGEFFIFAALLFFRRYKKFDGQIFWLYPLLYSILRSLIEMFRGDAARGLYFGGAVSTSQLISLVMFAASLFMLLSSGGKKYRHEH